MKKNIIFTMAALAALTLASCQAELQPEEILPAGEEPVTMQTDTVKTFSFSIQAGKQDDGDTKALDLSADGKNLSLTWNQGDKVEMFFRGKDWIYGSGTQQYHYIKMVTPDATPEADPKKAALEGEIFEDNVPYNIATFPMEYSPHDVSDTTYTLDLYYPRADFVYTGQNGALKGSGSIEENYEYAFGRVRITGVSEIRKVDDEYNLHLYYDYSTTGATFRNQQSIYRFGFNGGSGLVNFREFTIYAGHGKLVTSRSPLETDIFRDISTQGVSLDPDTPHCAYDTKYGPLTVTPGNVQPDDKYYYVSIRNEYVGSATEADRYTFVAYDTSGALYTGYKDIPASVLNVQGRFISAKNVAVAKVKIPEKPAATLTEIL